MAALKALQPTTVSVVRDGVIRSVDATSLVPGDIVKVVGGEKVPADIRILQSSDLKVNNASLTGENLDIKLGYDANHIELYEAKNIARMGTNFVNGSGTGVVFSTGDRTFFGSIAQAATQIPRPPALIRHEIERLIKIMSFFAICLGITFLILALVNGYNAVESIVFLISIIVANVPEGLLPQMTVALTLTAQRMLKQGVLVQNLEIIETLGAVTVICSDKTGTLTQNKMSASHIVYNNKIHIIKDQTPIMQGDTFEEYDQNNSNFQQLHQALALNSDAIFLDDNPIINNRLVKGDASESAIIKLCQHVNDLNKFRESNKRIFALPFNSKKKWMLSINQIQGQKNLRLFVKGAPERVLDMCASFHRDGEQVKIDNNTKNEIEKLNEILAKRGERVLGAAYLDLDHNQYPLDYKFDEDNDMPNFPTTGLTFIGFISLVDPPRLSVKPSIAQCNNAGIQVFMVTGDHPITAHSIAKSLNLVTGPTQKELNEIGDLTTIPQAIVVEGHQMNSFDADDWSRVLSHKEIVFARTMPQQKQDIVRELHKLGHVVAMTGDGVNDAPALKVANVGIAMGSGSAVAKEAGQIVLLNDDFGSIVLGIREGRHIFNNLKKCITYVLSSNVPEIVPFLVFILAKWPLGIETISILLIDLGTDITPTVALAYEEPEDHIMTCKPRSNDDHLLSWRVMIIAYFTIGVIQTIAAYFAFFQVFYAYGFDIDMLTGSGIKFKNNWDQLDTERQTFFSNMCANHQYYASTVGGNCTNDFTSWRQNILIEAQSAFLLTVVWAQIANVLVRKTSITCSLTWERIKSNQELLWSIIIEIITIVIFVYVPGLNGFLGLSYVKPIYASSGLFVIPWIFIFDEFRKWIIRTNPEGKYQKLLLI